MGKYVPLIDPSTTRFNAGWEVRAQESYKLKLIEGLAWFPRRERRQMLRERLKRRRSINRQWMLFGDCKMRLQLRKAAK